MLEDVPACGRVRINQRLTMNRQQKEKSPARRKSRRALLFYKAETADY